MSCSKPTRSANLRSFFMHLQGSLSEESLTLLSSFPAPFPTFNISFILPSGLSFNFQVPLFAYIYFVSSNLYLNMAGFKQLLNKK